MFGKLKKIYRWVGNATKGTARFLGNNQGIIKKSLSFAQQYLPIVAGAVSTVSPVIGGALLGLAKTAEFANNKYDVGLKGINKASDTVDRIDEGIERIKASTKRKK